MKQPPSLVQRLFLERLQRAHAGDPQAWVLVEDMTREAFGLPAAGLPITGPTAKGTLKPAQRISVRRAMQALSSQGLVEFAEQLPTERRRTSGPRSRWSRGHQRSVWARLATPEARPVRERREVDIPDDWIQSA